MQTIKANTKRGRAFLSSYNNSGNYSLRDCYDNYSTRKARAEIWFIDQMRRKSGDGFKILSFNTFGFSCGWITGDGLRVETPSNSYLIA